MMQNPVLCIAQLLGVLQLGVLANGQDVQSISCIFPFQSISVKFGPNLLCCNYSSNSEQLPRVFLDRRLQGDLEIQQHADCNVTYIVWILPEHNGREIAASYGTNALGRWNATVRISVQDMSTSITLQRTFSTGRDTMMFTLETSSPGPGHVNGSMEAGCGMSCIIGITLGTVMVILPSCCCVIVTVVYMLTNDSTPYGGISCSQGLVLWHNTSCCSPPKKRKNDNKQPIKLHDVAIDKSETTTDHKGVCYTAQPEIGTATDGILVLHKDELTAVHKGKNYIAPQRSSTTADVVVTVFKDHKGRFVPQAFTSVLPMDDFICASAMWQSEELPKENQQLKQAPMDSEQPAKPLLKSKPRLIDLRHLIVQRPPPASRPYASAFCFTLGLSMERSDADDTFPVTATFCRWLQYDSYVPRTWDALLRALRKYFCYEEIPDTWIDDITKELVYGGIAALTAPQRFCKCCHQDFTDEYDCYEIKDDSEGIGKAEEQSGIPQSEEMVAQCHSTM